MRLFQALLIAVFLLGAPGALPAGAKKLRAQFCGPTYQVQPGETLYAIAEKCRVSYLVLVSINFEMRDPNTIYPGQIIRLQAEAPLEFFEQPASGPAQDAGLQPGGTYAVRRGDSLALIAYLYATTVPELLEHNPQLHGRTTIRRGDILNMPPAARTEKGWVGLSTLNALRGGLIQVRVKDFTPYARVEFRLGDRQDEDSFDDFTVQTLTDARGEARISMRFPFSAFRGEIWEVHVINLDDGDAGPVISAGILIN